MKSARSLWLFLKYPQVSGDLSFEGEYYFD
jgi:hypothetical protein